MTAITPAAAARRARPFLALAAAIVTQGCLGGYYAWSAFVPALREAYGFEMGQSQAVFGLAVASFTASMLVAGRLLSRVSARRVALAGAGLFVAGHGVSAASDGRFLWLLAGSGVLAGGSIGFGYVAALTTAVRWFPRHKGLATGLTAAGFGGGAILLSAVASRLLGAGCPVLEVMRRVGLGYGAVLVAAALCLFRPPDVEAAAGRAAAGRCWREAVFWRLAAGLFCGTFAGLLVIGNLVPIGLSSGLRPEQAGAAIGLFAAGNASGRILWGYAADRYGYPTIPWSLVFFGCALAALALFRPLAALYGGSVFLVGFGFGACFVLYAAQAAARFGPSRLAEVYPLVFIGHGVAGLCGPLLGGGIHDRTGSYTGALLAALAVLLAGAWLTRVRTGGAAAGEAR